MQEYSKEDRIISAFSEGKTAGFDAELEIENPYVENTDEFQAWLEGYNQGQADLRGTVLLYTGCSSWTSAGRNHAVHIADDERRPLCGKSYKGGALDVWEGKETDVTCKKCRAKHLKRLAQESFTKYA